jgi:hypothetical protein
MQGPSLSELRRRTWSVDKYVRQNNRTTKAVCALCHIEFVSAIYHVALIHQNPSAILKPASTKRFQNFQDSVGRLGLATYIHETELSLLFTLII